MNYILDKSKSINSKRQPKNLKRILTSSKFDSNISETRVSRCGDRRCKTCPDLTVGKEITFLNNKRFEVRSNMNCKTEYVVYTLTCKNCGEFYVGKTTNMLKQRMTVHRQQTNDPNLRILNVKKHFHLCSGGRFTIFPIYRVSNSNDSMLDEKEKLFIKFLQPSLNA